MLGVRPADLRRLRDVRTCRHPLPRPRGRPRWKEVAADQAADRTARARHGARDGQRSDHKGADRDQCRDLSHHRGAGPGGGFNNPAEAVRQHDPSRARASSTTGHVYNGLGAQGDWWRFGTAMFLHASLLHIGFNMYALWLIGTPLEQYLGRARYVGLYLVSGLAGSAGALLLTPLSPTFRGYRARSLAYSAR